MLVYWKYSCRGERDEIDEEEGSLSGLSNQEIGNCSDNECKPPRKLGWIGTISEAI